MNALFCQIGDEIRKRGAISFARFMELALYCPVYGYYERERDTVGRRGDYYTSVSVGPLFGELLAFQFANWLEELRPPALSGSLGANPLQVVEAGAHGGDLAADILGWLQQWRPELYQTVEYWIIEPSARRKTWQAERLQMFSGKVQWLSSVSSLVTSAPVGSICGVVFSNELLDAMPTHRWAWDARRQVWFEWGVGLEAGRFAWVRLDSQPVSITPPAGLLKVLPDGFTVEVSPAARTWWREAAQALGQGKLLTFDYGWEQEEIWRPERSGGSLRAYAAHRAVDALLDRPGEQDLTAHVNFSELSEAGESAGLVTERLQTQAQYLTRIAAEIWRQAGTFPTWTPERTRQFQTLIHPEHLGRAFRVLVQARMTAG